MTAATRLLRPLPHVPKSKHETQYSHRRQVEVLRVVGRGLVSVQRPEA